uniref:BTB domain-containing protein n=1 Tax=Globodera rostochiensis TaxID=31243 RepID=A0A914GZJ7_GLORO
MRRRIIEACRGRPTEAAPHLLAAIATVTWHKHFGPFFPGLNNCGDFSLCREHIISEFSDLIDFKFKLVNESQRLQIKDAAASHPTNVPGPLAQIVSWKWEGGAQKIEKIVMLDRGGSADLECLKYSFVIRILKKREVVENPCLPISSPDDDLNVHIGDRQVTVSATEMREKQQRALNLNSLDITMEQFMQFLETISFYARHGRTLSNPTNVLYLLKLADYFQIDWLKERCEAHLINCVEIPLIERFHLIERYRLNNLKHFFLHCLSVVRLRAFIKANHQQLLTSISQEFWIQLTVRLCDWDN